MTKPWEQEWRVENDTHDTAPEIHGPDGLVASVKRRRVHVGGGNGKTLHEEATQKATLIAAAPDMARALRDALSVLHRAEDVLEMGQVRGLRDACETVEAALRKAGVIP